jgi:hypothetical protein
MRALRHKDGADCRDCFREDIKDVDRAFAARKPFIRVAQDFQGLVLDTAWLRIDLPVFFPRGSNDAAGRIEDEEARASDSLVDDACVCRHEHSQRMKTCNTNSRVRAHQPLQYQTESRQLR